MKSCLFLLLTLILATGSGCTKKLPKNKKLAALDFSQRDAEASTNFTTPNDINDIIGFTLVFEDTKKGFDRDSSLALRILFQVHEPDNPQPIHSLEYDKSKMVYTNWHRGSTSVYLGRQSYFGRLKTDKEHKIAIKIMEPDPNLGDGSLHFHWFEKEPIW